MTTSTPNVSWRADRGSWLVRWQDGPVRRARAFREKQEALDFANEVYRRRRLGVDVSFDRGTERLADWAVYVWDTYYEHRLAPATKSAYRVIWNRHVLPNVGSLQLREIRPREIAALRAQLHRQGVGDPTIIRALSMLQGMLKYAVIEGEIPTNPVAVVEKPRQRTEGWPDPLGPIDVERIRAVLGSRDRLIVSLLAYAGLRPGELCALRWEHVRGGKLRVFAPKTRRERYINLLEPLAEDLREWRVETGLDFGPVVTTRRDRAPMGTADWRNWRSRVWYGKRQDGPAFSVIHDGDRRPYRLRGGFASLLAWEGQPITYVAQQLGHSVQTCSRYYLGIFEGHDPDARVPAAEAIRRARSAVGSDLLTPNGLQTTAGPNLRVVDGSPKSDPEQAKPTKPSNGLEPLTPSLPWKCSTN